MKSKTNIYDLLNPCQILESNRHQAFVESSASSYNPTGEIRFTLPNSENVDLTQSYIDCTCLLNTTDAEVPSVYSLDLTGAIAGSFKLGYKGYYTGDLAFNIAAIDLQTALDNLFTIGRSGYTVVVGLVGQVYTITISNFDQFGLSFDDSSSLIFEEFTALTGLILLHPLTQTTAGVLSFPRLEFLNPIITQFRVNVGSEQIIAITDYEVLSSIMELSECINAGYSKFYLNNFQINGFRSSSEFRIRINLKAIDFARKIFPLTHIKEQIRFYLQLGSNDDVLVQGSSGGGSYQILDPRFHYHRVDLTYEENQAIKDALSSEGLIIPFKNFTTFSDSLSIGVSNQNILFNPASSNLLGICFVMYGLDYSQTPQNTRKFTTYLRNKIGSYRLKVGSKYFPLDQIDSLVSGNDQVEIILNLEQFLELINSSDDKYDRELYLNYEGFANGSDPTQLVFIEQFGQPFSQTWCAGISCSDHPSNKYGYICRSDAMSGQDVSNLSNVSLELKGLSLTETNQLLIYVLTQEFIVFTDKGHKWVK